MNNLQSIIFVLFTLDLIHQKILDLFLDFRFLISKNLYHVAYCFLTHPFEMNPICLVLKRRIVVWRHCTKRTNSSVTVISSYIYLHSRFYSLDSHWVGETRLNRSATFQEILRCTSQLWVTPKKDPCMLHFIRRILNFIREFCWVGILRFTLKTPMCIKKYVKIDFFFNTMEVATSSGKSATQSITNSQH